MTRLITMEGLEKIKEELKNRKIKTRREIAGAIKEAKEQGDLSENAEYSEAKRQQGENESQIAKLEAEIKNCRVAERDKSTDSVQLGSMVRVKLNQQEMEFHIVGSSEADPINLKISNESPIGKSFIGRNKGDKVEVETPQGKIKYEILAVI